MALERDRVLFLVSNPVQITKLLAIALQRRQGNVRPLPLTNALLVCARA